MQRKCIYSFTLLFSKDAFTFIPKSGEEYCPLLLCLIQKCISAPWLCPNNQLVDITDTKEFPLLRWIKYLIWVMTTVFSGWWASLKLQQCSVGLCYYLTCWQRGGTEVEPQMSLSAMMHSENKVDQFTI